MALITTFGTIVLQKTVRFRDEGSTKLANLANESQHMACDVAFGESSTGVGKKILPFSFESIVMGALPKARVIF
jgi:hypothetical protein